jgi:hypothetical protein
MRRLYFSILCIAIFVSGSPAGAAVITEISWDVTGGSFGGPFSTGDITGGQLRLVATCGLSTPRTGSITTPFTGPPNPCYVDPPSIWLTLTGPSGYFKARLTGVGTGNLFGSEDVTITPGSVKASGIAYGPLTTGTTTRNRNDFSGFGSFVHITANTVAGGSAGWRSYGQPTVSHTFTIGNEVRTLQAIPVAIDIKPGSDPNSINPNASGDVAVAILGSDTFDVADIDGETLAFGPPGEPGAPIEHANGPHLEDKPNHPYDVNEDGFADALAHFVVAETGIMAGNTEACVTGELGGQSFEGCDAIRTEVACGLGAELVLLLPPLAWQYRRRRIRSAR